ncbi:transposase [Rubrobacter marinus]|uniref:transposase n=1 Tax=Rubrobacter marinus TaxID=2653852 RepID=UPI00389987A7
MSRNVKMARRLLSGLKPLVPRLEKICADGAYGGEPLAEWCRDEGGRELEVVGRDREASGFRVEQKRWIFERTFGRLGMSRRLAKELQARGPDRRDAHRG